MKIIINLYIMLYTLWVQWMQLQAYIHNVSPRLICFPNYLINSYRGTYYFSRSLITWSPSGLATTACLLIRSEGGEKALMWHRPGNIVQVTPFMWHRVVKNADIWVDHIFYINVEVLDKERPCNCKIFTAIFPECIDQNQYFYVYNYIYWITKRTAPGISNISIITFTGYRKNRYIYNLDNYLGILLPKRFL